jgi:DNA-binding NarL/FixJ family response regulator
MTAHAMKGDRERCLAVGMDGYASKPIRIKDLEGVINQLTQSEQSPQVPAPTTNSEADVIDEETVRQVLMVTENCCAKLFGYFSP